MNISQAEASSLLKAVDPVKQIEQPKTRSDFSAPRMAPAIQLLLRLLEDEGVQYVFGIPGGPLMPLYEAISESWSIRHVLTKHEEGAAFMADGYARVSGGLGVCCATTGPGATNALTGIACAYMDSIPVLLLTAQVAIGAFGKGAAQESSMHGIDVVELYKPVTKASLMLLSSDKMAETVRFAIRTALTGRPGPVHLNLPADMVKRDAAGVRSLPFQYRPSARQFDRDAVIAACDLISRAHRPVILAGHGVYLAKAWQELRRFAEQLHIPVATTPKAKGIFPEDHLLSLGVFGFAGSPQADACLLSGDVDVLVCVGTSLGELSTHCWSEKLRPREALIHIDIDPTVIGRNYPTNVGVVGDVKTVLTEMRFHSERAIKWKDKVDFSRRKHWLAEIKNNISRFVSSAGFDDLSMPLKPQRFIKELQDVLPANTILNVDIGNVMAWALHFLNCNEPGGFQINLGLASMGHAVASVIGGKLAAPDRTLVALVGDAAFAMNGMEVHTAVEFDVPAIWIVMNNGGHGMVCHGEQIQFKGKVSTGKFSKPLNIAGLAEAMGALAWLVTKPGELKLAFNEALRSGRPSVIEVIIDPDVMPPMSLRIETLDKFFDGTMK